MTEVGVIHARFQVLHLKQMEYILAAKMRCKKLYIGVSHPDIVNFAASSNLDAHGVTKRDNPMTYIERYQMLLATLQEFRVKREEFEIIPFPISTPDLLEQYAPLEGVYYMSLMTTWDEERLRILQSLGLKTEVIWERDAREIGVTSSDIKEMIAAGNADWKSKVPKSVSEFVVSRGIEERIRELHYVS
ncbi:MAG: nicotinate-nucleotide adenylyltransferase [Lachnospiraceae bacterium]|nr:nicotinate-nucleotide adenylyltransferase [Lachnospiraceae bacterium]